MNLTFYIFLILVAFGGLFFSFNMSEAVSLYVFLIFVSFSGILLASYIFYKKRSRTELTCPIGSNCKAVIYSEYSKFLGVPIELGGMVYYAIIFAIYTALIVFPTSIPSWVVFGGIGISAASFLFSVYLTFIQGFVLRQWCCWCLLSALFSSVILIISLGTLQSILSFLLEIRSQLISLHMLGLSLGLGGVTIASILLFKFLKDFRLSQWEAGILKTVSQIIWIALALLVLSGIALYLPEMQELNTSPSFFVKMFAVLIIVVSRVILNLIIAPCLIVASHEEKKENKIEQLCRLRKGAIVLSAVSLASWYFVFLLGALRDSSFGLLPLLVAYLFLLIIAALAGWIVEKGLSKKDLYSPVEKDDI